MAEIKWKGGWSGSLGVSDTTYYRNDVVLYDNITYIVTAVSVAIGSPNPTQDMAKWNTFVSGAESSSGTSGTSGISGVDGTSGSSGTTPIGSARIFTSGTAGTSWTFTHNLGTPAPIVQVWGTSGQVIMPTEITSLNNNQVKIDFPEPVAGWATIGNGYSGTAGTSGTSGTSPVGSAQVFTAGTAGTSWTFTHNLGTPAPIVQVWGTSGQVIIPSQIRSLDNNTIRIEFPVAVAGSATIGNGYSGTSGSSGTHGTSGTNGTNGTSGTSGTAGSSGSSGTSPSGVATTNITPNYIYAGRITLDQSSVGKDSDIIFNSSIASSGIALNTATGVFTLSANKTYKITSSISWAGFSDDTNGYVIYAWVDSVTNTQIDTTGVGRGVAVPLNRTNANEVGNTSPNLIYTPTTNQTIKLRVIDGTGISTVRAGMGSFVTIEQINPTVTVTNGTSGISGVAGTSGTSGINGAAGTSGTSGAGGMPTGGTSGQFLIRSAGTTGAAEWATLGSWTAGNGVFIGAPITTPTIPAIRIQNLTRYKLTGPKTAAVQLMLSYTNSIGGDTGNGQYFFSLPTGIQFGSVHPTDGSNQSGASLNNVTTTNLAHAIPAAGHISNAGGDLMTQIVIIPISATAYRVAYSTGGTDTTFVSSTYNGFINGALTYCWQFDITIA